jgi:hypothetical protein
MEELAHHFGAVAPANGSFSVLPRPNADRTLNELTERRFAA